MERHTDEEKAAIYYNKVMELMQFANMDSLVREVVIRKIGSLKADRDENNFEFRLATALLSVLEPFHNRRVNVFRTEEPIEVGTTEPVKEPEYQTVEQLKQAIAPHISYEAIDVANQLIEFASQDGKALNAQQLMKLVYLCHGFSLSRLGYPLIKETIEAWQYGPTIPELYSELKEYRGDPIHSPIKRPVGSPKFITHVIPDLICKVYQKYGHYSGVQLSTMTHQEGSPWALVWEQGMSKAIPNSVIHQYFAALEIYGR